MGCQSGLQPHGCIEGRADVLLIVDSRREDEVDRAVSHVFACPGPADRHGLYLHENTVAREVHPYGHLCLERWLAAGKLVVCSDDSQRGAGLRVDLICSAA